MKYSLTVAETRLVKKVRKVPLVFKGESDGFKVSFPKIEVSQAVGGGLTAIRTVDRFSGDEEIIFIK